MPSFDYTDPSKKKFLKGKLGSFLEDNQQNIGAGIGVATDLIGAFGSNGSASSKGGAIGGAIGTGVDAAFFGGLPIASTVGKTLGSIIGGGSDRRKQAESDQREREAMMRDTNIADLSDDERYGYSPYMEEGGLVLGDDKKPKKKKQNTSITTKRGNVITDEDLEKNIQATQIPWQSKDQYGEWLDKFAEPIPEKTNSTVTYPYGKRGETMTQDEWDYVRKKRGYPDVYSDKKQGTDNFIPGESFANEVRNSIKEYRTLTNTAKMGDGGKVKPYKPISKQESTKVVTPKIIQPHVDMNTEVMSQYKNDIGGALMDKSPNLDRVAALKQMLLNYGNPSVDYGYVPSGYIGMNNYMSGNITLSKDLQYNGDNIESAILAELSHSKQNKNGIIPSVIQQIKDIPRYITDPKSVYKTKGTMEYQAHEEIEPEIIKEFDSLKSKNRMNRLYPELMNKLNPSELSKLPNKRKMEDGGEVMDYSQEATYQPIEVNIEKGELLTDQEGNIIREFNNPNRFAPHNKNSYKEPSGNFVELPEGAIVIPKKDAKVFKQGDSITKKSILRNILQNQAETSTPNIREEEVYMEEGGRVPYKNYGNPDYVFNADEIIQRARGFNDPNILPELGSPRMIPISAPKVTGDLSYRVPDNSAATISSNNNKANLGYYLHEAAPYLAQASNIALANKPDTYLSPEYNNRADEAYQYLNNMDTDYDISLGLSRNESALGTALRGQRDRNTPASGVIASEMLGRTLSSNNELANVKNQAELQLRNNKAGALAQFVNQRGEGERAENIRYQTEQRMNEGNRRSEMSGAINNIAEIAQQQVNSREKIKALNSMTEFHDLDPSKQKLITDDPQARDRILKLVNTGYSPQMAFKMVLGADLASADNVKRTTTEKTSNGSVRTTTSN